MRNKTVNIDPEKYYRVFTDDPNQKQALIRVGNGLFGKRYPDTTGSTPLFKPYDSIYGMDLYSAESPEIETAIPITLTDLITAVQEGMPLAPIPIGDGEYSVKVQVDGLRVGCEFVSWPQYDEIVARVNEVRPK